VVGAVGGFMAAAFLDTSQKTHENVQLASVTLLFGALLGGVIKLLLDDVQHARERRAEQSRFIAAMLDDLKSVYDRVERTRILLRAHRSALTYGKEMRDLIDARVQLRNVVRAIDAQTSGISPDIVGDLRRAVAEMELYIRRLTDEFQLDYKRISDKQKIHEARVTGRLKALEQDPDAADPYTAIGEANEAWKEMTAKLSAVKAFMGESNKTGDAVPGAAADPLVEPPTYKEAFEDPLDLASWLLRSELQKPGKTRRAEIPSGNLEAIAKRLRDKERKNGGQAERMST
jgi:methyl-accepting chemotaxis protein